MSYFNNRAVSNSALSYINPAQGGSPAKFKRFLDGYLKEEHSPSLEKGDLLHKFMLEPGKFETVSISKPSDTICGIIDEVFRFSLIDNRGEALADYREIILDSCLERSYGQNWKEDTRVGKVCEAGQEYFAFKRKADGKLIVDHQTMVILGECMTGISMNDKARNLLNQQTTQKYVVYHELEIYWRITVDGQEVECKSKIDKLILNQQTKTFNIVDLKTTSKNLFRYAESFAYWRTYRQLAFYEGAILYWLRHTLGVTNYKPGNYYIVACMTVEPFHSRVFHIPRCWIERGEAEYMSLLRRVLHHTQTGDWYHEMEHSLGTGIFTLEMPSPAVSEEILA